MSLKKILIKNKIVNRVFYHSVRPMFSRTHDKERIYVAITDCVRVMPVRCPDCCSAFHRIAPEIKWLRVQTYFTDVDCKWLYQCQGLIFSATFRMSPNILSSFIFSLFIWIFLLNFQNNFLFFRERKLEKRFRKRNTVGCLCNQHPKPANVCHTTHIHFVVWCVWQPK